MTNVPEGFEDFLKQEIKNAVKRARRSDIDFLSGLAARTAIAKFEELD
jgi:methionine synthase II (cobalamin-independent)